MKNIIPCSRRKEEHHWGNCDFSWPLDSHGMCILHSANKEKDENAFNEAIQKQMKSNQMIDFTSVCFPIKVSFRKMKFERPIILTHAKFLDDVEFQGVEFFRKR